MTRHSEPRWTSVLWLLLFLGIIGSFIAVGLHRGYDFVQTAGFLGACWFEIFALSLLAALVPYAVTLFLKLRR
jgi:hypothetical protein